MVSLIEDCKEKENFAFKPEINQISKILAS